MPVLLMGCDLYLDCLRCPLPRCRFDEKARRSRAARMLQARDILKERTSVGKSVAELAAEHDLSKRTIQRIIRRGEV